MEIEKCTSAIRWCAAIDDLRELLHTLLTVLAVLGAHLTGTEKLEGTDKSATPPKAQWGQTWLASARESANMENDPNPLVPLRQ